MSRLLPSSSNRALLLWIAAATAAGCNPAPPIPPADAGADAPMTSDTRSDGGRDAAVLPAPEVIATVPADGAVRVALGTEIQVAFSGTIDEASVTLALSSDAGPITLGAPAWNGTSTVVTATPTTALPAGVEVTLTISAGYQLASPDVSEPGEEVVVSFVTEDTEAPTFVVASPPDGATVPLDLAEITLEASEPMRSDRGTGSIVGPGSPELGPATWTDRTVHFTVAGLVADATYEIVLDGFVDLAGNALDLVASPALGGDGRLDLATGEDMRAPVVVASAPNEGQLDLEVALVSQVELTFSEPMTPSGVLALSVDGGAAVALTAVWDRGDTRVRASVAGLLGAEAPHEVTLTGLEDVAGNALDGVTYLGDGALDFTTGVDSFAPFVAYMEPNEGDTAVAAGTDRVIVTFSEAMPPAFATVTLVGDGRSVTLTGTWSAGNTILTLPAPMLQGGRSYTIDFAAFRDPGGTALDRAHPYLGDGVASFTIVAPRGERCGDALTEVEGTATPDGYRWTLAASAFTANDGSAACDLNGHTPDGVIRFRKTGTDTVLHVHADGVGSDGLDVEIYAEHCRPTATTADAARLRCMPDRDVWDSWLDVPAGDYFVWIATEAGAPFDGAEVTIEEVAEVRAGESCAAPLDTTSSETIYTPPAAPGGFHRWVLPAGYADAPDRGVGPDDSAPLACLPVPSSLGHDAVIAFEKTSATSLVTVRLAMPASGSDAGIEIARGCDPADATYTTLTCDAHIDAALATERTLDGAAGPLSVWVVDRRSFPLPGGGWTDTSETTIEIAEFEPQLGDTCTNAIPLVVGTNSVTATRPNRAYVPACLATGGVTWFRYTPTQGLGLLRTDGATIAAVVDPDGTTVRCGDEAATTMPVFGVPGQPICIALTSSASVHSITIEELPYTGSRGIETEVPIVRDPSLPTLTPSFGTHGWMAVHAGEIWRGGFSAVFHAPIGGGLYTWTVPAGFACRYGGLSRPDGIYCLAERAAVDLPRLHRIVDATGAPLAVPVPIDVPPTSGTLYPPRRFDAVAWDGTRFIVGSSAQTGTSIESTYFFAIGEDGVVEALGSNDILNDVGGLAVDATYVYVTGRIGTTEGVYRLRRDDLDTPTTAPVELASGFDLVSDGAAIAVDSTTAAHALWFRTLGNSGSRADIRMILEPGAASPAWTGIFWRAPGNAQDNGFGFDPSGPTLWLLHTNGPSGSFGHWLRLD